VTLRAAALAEAHRGETTYEEVLRVTHVDDGNAHRCPACARALADDMVCCPWDGAVVGRDRCPGCDRALDAEWGTCPWCRTPVAERRAQPAVLRPSLPRLLVVDDDQNVCQFVASALAGAVDITLAYTATEALQLLGSRDFDGVLLDNVLPDLSGVELIRLLRNDPKTLTLPVLLFTGIESPSIEREALQAGADDFLTKPVEPLLLEERIVTLLQRETRELPTAPSRA
jgi:CheY-like chemotaxis protein